MFDLLVLLIPIFPLLAVISNGIFGARYSTELAGRLAFGSVGLSFLCALGVLGHVVSDPTPREVIAYSWFFGGDLAVDLGFLIDPLTTVFLMVITGVGLLIHIYSTGYMHGEEGFTRFFTYMNLFMVSMLLLVMGNNYVVLFIGWEGVGLCSYLLIGYYYEKISAGKAATKAFVVNRIGDAGFLLAVFLIFTEFQTLDYLKVLEQAPQLSTGMATAIALCLLVGAVGKSAQLPLYTWLPDAMEGPTPVSALIHAATMVTAGVYMIVRNHAIFDMAPAALTTVGLIGGVTALFAATIGLVQNDIKRVLAYSTVSQLGYMFLACGIGAYTAAIFHVVTHAFFKALLFLSAGAVIHSLEGEQDIRKMGGLHDKIPKTYKVFLIGTIAIAGIPPLAGFWSKDEIMAHAFIHHHYLLYLFAAIGALLTSFYMFRLTNLTFYGNSRVDPKVESHIHESPNVMLIPLMILAGLSVFGGLILGFPPEHGLLHSFLHDVATPLGAAPHEVNIGLLVGLATFATLIAVSGWALARYMYLTNPGVADEWAQKASGAYTTILNKYYVDELYDKIFVEPCKRLGELWDWIDRNIIDRFVIGIGNMTDVSAAGITWTEKHVMYAGLNVIGFGHHIAAWAWRKLQTGMVHHYAAVITIGLFILVHVAFLWFTGATAFGQ